MLRLITSVLVALFAVGCKSGRLGPYVSPRVTGHVLAGDNEQPLAGVHVTRASAHYSGRTRSAMKGSELLMEKVPALTDLNGRFVLPGERVLSIVRGSGWNTVSLRFERIGYQSFQTNYPLTMAATTTNNGEPVLNVGGIILQRAVK